MTAKFMPSSESGVAAWKGGEAWRSRLCWSRFVPLGKPAIGAPGGGSLPCAPFVHYRARGRNPPNEGSHVEQGSSPPVPQSGPGGGHSQGQYLLRLRSPQRRGNAPP